MKKSITNICAAIALMVGTMAGTMAENAYAAPVKKKTVAKVAPKPLPVFDFMGQTTDTERTMTELNGKPCTTTDNETACGDYGEPRILGWLRLEYLTLRFNNEKLYQVMGKFESDKFESVFEGFVTKYGRAKIESEMLQNNFGVKFENVIATWRFKGGTLRLVRFGNTLSHGTFFFSSYVNAPPEPDRTPKIDF